MKTFTGPTHDEDFGTSLLLNVMALIPKLQQSANLLSALRSSRCGDYVAMAKGVNTAISLDLTRTYLIFLGRPKSLKRQQFGDGQTIYEMVSRRATGMPVFRRAPPSARGPRPSTHMGNMPLLIENASIEVSDVALEAAAEFG